MTALLSLLAAALPIALRSTLDVDPPPSLLLEALGLLGLAIVFEAQLRIHAVVASPSSRSERCE